MNSKGLVLSVYVYVLLVFFLLLLASLLVVLNNTRIISDRVKESAYQKVTDTKYGFSIELAGPRRICQSFGVEYNDPGFRAIDEDGKEIGIIVNSNLDIWSVGTYEIEYTARHNNKEKSAVREVVIYKSDFDYTGSQQEFYAMCDGIYRVELWGAKGGGVSDGGRGGYTKGEIYLTSGTQLYVYVGEQGSLGTFGNNTNMTVGQGASSTFNGGGAGGNAGGGSYPYANYRGGASGGGATDIRLTPGVWSNTNALRSRIMVAGGGGGTNHSNNGFDDHKGHAGGLSGHFGALYSTMSNYVSNVNRRGKSGMQIAGNAFGIGGDGDNTGHPGYCNGHSGGGGGYFGGEGGSHTGGQCHMIGGGGGSSFISGYFGANAIDVNGNPTNQPIHYSGIKFDNMVMLSGADVMPNPNGSVQTGNVGDGYARIIYLGTKEVIDNQRFEMKKFTGTSNNTGVKLRIQKPDDALDVMIRRKTSPWTLGDSTSTGVFVTDNALNTNTANLWYNKTNVIDDETYYYKAFPRIDGKYRYIPFLNEIMVTSGGLETEYSFEDSPLDTSGNDNHPAESASITYTHGVIGKSASFSTNSYIYSPAVFDSGTFSVSLWAKVPNNNTPRVLVSDGDERGFTIGVDSSNNYSFSVNFGGIQNFTIPTTTNKWTHIVMVVNTEQGYIKVYYDGVLRAYNVYPGDYVPTNLTGSSRVTCIGCIPTQGSRTMWFDGKIDQLRMYDRELRPFEVLLLYNE